MNTIEVNGLVRRFGGTTAVDELSFDVRAGEVFGLLGPNGAGKSTTIRLLTGQLRPTSGTAKVCGFDVVRERERLKPAIGVVFEHHNLYERMTARGNLRFSARLYGVDGEHVDRAIRVVGLSEHADKPAGKLSNGMKQRLLIGRAILHEPRVLFLDEPTKGLDPGVARSLRELVLELKARGVTVLLTTHYMEEADRLCDRVAVLDHGRMVALDAPATLKAASEIPDATLEDVFLAVTGRRLAQ